MKGVLLDTGPGVDSGQGELQCPVAPASRLCYTLWHLHGPFPTSHLKGLTPGEFMQQRRLRLGDIVDDYCPRERRITNHAIVAMIEDQVKQTRCTTCDADHEYKQARVPAQRKKKEGVPVLSADVPAGAPRKRAATRDVSTQDAPVEDVSPQNAAVQADVEHESVFGDEPAAAKPEATPIAEPPAATAAVAASPEPPVEDEGPVHRPLIRATLPRPEGQAPERKIPDFTVRQPGARGFDSNNGNAQRRAHGGQRRPARPGVRAPGANSSGQSTRFGQRHGNAPRHTSGRPTPAGQRHGRPAGESRGGRKRGR